MIEKCVICDEPTGRAGKQDDGIFCDQCENGSLCERCSYADSYWDRDADTICVTCARMAAIRAQTEAEDWAVHER